MVTATPNVYSTYVESHPTHENYLNKKIDMYEEKAVVVGKDMARGNFSKSFTDIGSTTSLQPEKTKTAEHGPCQSESITSSDSRSHRKRARVEVESSDIEKNF